MTTTGVWSADKAGFEMKRKSSFSLLDASVRHKTHSSGGPDNHMERLHQLMETYEANDPASIQKSFARHLEYSLACTRFKFTMQDAYRAAGLVLRDRLLESLNDTNAYYREMDVKRGYYLSAEYLIGRHMQNAIANLDLEQNFKDAFEDLGMKLEDLFAEEADPALGNGGLGRLAACFLDSMATLSLPCWGYGIRYSYGMFKQRIKDGRQMEEPDFWIGDGCPFEIPRPDVTYPVRFYGKVEEVHENGQSVCRWVGGDIVQAMAYDNPIPGFDTYNTNNLRLWRACPSKEFDLDAFSSAQFQDAITQRRKAEDLSAVLYPNDATYAGKELRLRQQYFFVSASLQDLLREFIKRPNYKWEELPDKVAVQMNDTHPTIAVAEMMRLLVDIQKLDWDKAWDLTRKCLNYTNHTVMPEALEKWPVEMLERMLPRHLQIIYHINGHWIQKLLQRYGDGPIIAALSIVEEGDVKKIRMGHLAVIGANKVNGVAAIHTEIIKKETFPEFYKWCCDNNEPNKIVNMTNGVTPRRWIHCANPALSEIFTKYLGSQEWLTNMNKLKAMLQYKEDPKLHEEWMAMKRGCKTKLADWLKSTMDLEIDQDALIDIQIKRIHEYKRQLLNILFVIHRYLELKKKSPGDRQSCQKRVVLIGGKAASAYVNAKIIIKLINNVAKVINNDPDTKQYLKCAFVPNYCVSAAQVMIPASDISEHISTAGTEASGTSNMKLLGSRNPTVGSFQMFLLAAQSTWPVSSARFFAQWMADSSKEPTTRQVAALLLKNIFEPVVGARTLFGEWLNYGEVRQEMHNACWLALQDAEPKLRRLAALCTARMGCWEIPQGQWPELLPELQRWAESGSQRHCHASLHTLRSLAEDGASLGVHTQAALLRTCGAQLLSCATEEACWAAEAVFAMLGWLHGADDLLGSQVVEALLVAHLAADARLAQEDAYAKELCSCILRC
ncbi:unnamed protein product [Cladocopium goreaui]|uniref:Alpha-1,4 glucan phosphorylase n=1 Tax=Cladocopium goreaui TaxID=2562237 RepID=A0A9P1C1U1_9DINO|nr:unnamed protein product [Cladocopium goreaui]